MVFFKTFAAMQTFPDQPALQVLIRPGLAFQESMDSAGNECEPR